MSALTPARDRGLYLAGLESFNQGAFFASHEHLEDLWLRNRSDARPFLQGLIQLAAAFHHLNQGRFVGLMALLKSASARLRPYAPHMLGVDVAHLLLAIEACRGHAEDLGPERLASFERTLLPRLSYTPPTLEEIMPHAGTEAAPRRA